jgi:hypothetical protein
MPSHLVYLAGPSASAAAEGAGSPDAGGRAGIPTAVATGPAAPDFAGPGGGGLGPAAVAVAIPVPPGWEGEAVLAGIPVDPLPAPVPADPAPRPRPAPPATAPPAVGDEGCGDGRAV